MANLSSLQAACVPDEELLALIGLAMVENIGAVRANTLLSYVGSAVAIFKSSKKELMKIDGIGEVVVKSILQFTNFDVAEKQLLYAKKNHIQIIPFTDVNNYPPLLQNCGDKPSFIFFKGNIESLRQINTVAIVGTRTNTIYGKQVTEQLIKQLALFKPVIVSGLAHGIDTIAHKVAVENNLPTIACLGHGLDMIYPETNEALAEKMLAQGGWLTDMFFFTKPERQNFPKRNRLIAGLSLATIVIESKINGGSLITAQLANDYNRDVFAFPGRSTDAKSLGTNNLIKNQQAQLITGADDFINYMNWNVQTVKPALQLEMFEQLTEIEKQLYALLKTQKLSIDELLQQSSLPYSQVSATLLSMELKGILRSLPGKIYEII